MTSSRSGQPTWEKIAVITRRLKSYKVENLIEDVISLTKPYSNSGRLLRQAISISISLTSFQTLRKDATHHSCKSRIVHLQKTLLIRSDQCQFLELRTSVRVKRCLAYSRRGLGLGDRYPEITSFRSRIYTSARNAGSQ